MYPYRVPGPGGLILRKLTPARAKARISATCAAVSCACTASTSATISASTAMSPSLLGTDANISSIPPIVVRASDIDGVDRRRLVAAEIILTRCRHSTCCDADG